MDRRRARALRRPRLAEERVPVLRDRAHGGRGAGARQGRCRGRACGASRAPSQQGPRDPALPREADARARRGRPADLQSLRDAGISDDAIADAVYVCFLFNTFNRLVFALGCEVMDAKQLDKVSKMLLEKGYDL